MVVENGQLNKPICRIQLHFENADLKFRGQLISMKTFSEPLMCGFSFKPRRNGIFDVQRGGPTLSNLSAQQKREDSSKTKTPNALVRE